MGKNYAILSKYDRWHTITKEQYLEIKKKSEADSEYLGKLSFSSEKRVHSYSYPEMFKHLANIYIESSVSFEFKVDYSSKNGFKCSTIHNDPARQYPLSNSFLFDENVTTECDAITSRLEVELPNGNVISGPSSQIVYALAILSVEDIRDVIAMDISISKMPIISRVSSSFQEYVMIAHQLGIFIGLSLNSQAKVLTKISDSLGLNWKVIKKTKKDASPTSDRTIIRHLGFPEYQRFKSEIEKIKDNKDVLVQLGLPVKEREFSNKVYEKEKELFSALVSDCVNNINFNVIPKVEEHLNRLLLDSSPDFSCVLSYKKDIGFLVDDH